MTDPRRFDLLARSVTTALITLVIISVAAYEAVTRGHVDDFTAGWGAIILGVYFGSHVSMNGAGARAKQDQELRAEINAEKAAPTAPPVVP